MIGYIKDLFSLFRKHYAENVRFYSLLALQIFGVPLVLTILTRSAQSAASMSLALACLTVLLAVHVSIKGLRSRYTYMLENTLPLSAGVRYGFIMINSTIVALLGFVVLYFPSLWLSYWLFPIDESFKWVLELTLSPNFGTIATVLGIHAVILVVNILVRKRPLVGYVLAMLFMVFVSHFIRENVAFENRDTAMMIANLVIAATLWIGSYFLLRKFQYKS